MSAIARGHWRRRALILLANSVSCLPVATFCLGYIVHRDGWLSPYVLGVGALVLLAAGMDLWTFRKVVWQLVGD